MPKKQSPNVDARRFTRKLPVKLKAHERTEMSEKVFDLMSQEDEKRAELATVTAPLREGIKELVSERERLRKVLKAGEEERDVNCSETRDYTAGEVWHVRVDTRAEVPGSRRTMTAEERQETFPHVKGGPKKSRQQPNDLDDLDHADPRPANP